MNESTPTIRIRAKFYNSSLFCAYTPTEEKDDVVKDAFYTKLEDVYDEGPAHFNAKVGR